MDVPLRAPSVSQQLGDLEERHTQRCTLPHRGPELALIEGHAESANHRLEVPQLGRVPQRWEALSGILWVLMPVLPAREDDRLYDREEVQP